MSTLCVAGAGCWGLWERAQLLLCGVAAHRRVNTASGSQLPGPRCIKTRQTRHQTPILGHCEHAGRQTSRAGRRNMATVKPTTPLLTPNKGPLKPPSPLHPQTAPKTPISDPQRRRRFQTHTDTGKQRRSRFQTPGHLADRAWLRRPWTATTPPPAKFRT